MTSNGRWLGHAKLLLHRSRALYTPLSLMVLSYLILSDPDVIGDQLEDLEPRLIGAMFLLITVGHLGIALTTRLLFLAQGEGPAFGLVLRTHIDRLPARYLPGGIWQTVSRAADFSARGVPHAVILRVLTVEMVLAPSLAAVLGAALLLAGGAESRASYLVLAGLLGTVGLVLGPAVVGLRRSAGRLGLRWAYPGAIGAFALVWGLYGAAFYLFLSQVWPGVPWSQAGGAYLLSWLAGFLAFFAPQGIGVFEVSASLLLTGGLATAFIGTLFAFRLLTMLADIGLWVGLRVWFFAYGSSRRRTEPPSP